ncbi:MAG: hypothetical protein ABSB49_01700 [Polyangia bacterium]|jgi:hypothetical protein
MNRSPTPGIAGLAHEAVLGFVHLLGQHVKVAQLELTCEIHSMGRRACLFAVLATFVALGYGLAMTGLAILVGGHAAVGYPFVVIGLAHMVGAGTVLLLVPLRPHGSHLMDSSQSAMNTSLVALAEATAPSTPPTPGNAHAHG